MHGHDMSNVSSRVVSRRDNPVEFGLYSAKVMHRAVPIR